MTGPEPTVASIIEGLGQPGPVPRPALDEAASRWNECAPAFLELIERAATSDLADATGMDAVFLVVHLCAQMQETRAFRPILRLMRADRAVIEDLLGDTTTATLPRVVAAVFDGDVAPLHQAILDAQADEYVRWSLFDALAILTRDGRVPRASTLEFLRSCFDALQSCGAEEVWTALLEAVARLGLDELRPQAEAALRAERVISELMSQEEFDDVFAGTLRGDQDPIWRTEPFGTVAEELANWQHNTTEEFEKAENEPLDLGYREKPATNPFRNVGRNDPCPCGSGKKYKKCCLAA